MPIRSIVIGKLNAGLLQQKKRVEASGTPFTDHGSSFLHYRPQYTMKHRNTNGRNPFIKAIVPQHIVSENLLRSQHATDLSRTERPEPSSMLHVVPICRSIRQ